MTCTVRLHCTLASVCFHWLSVGKDKFGFGFGGTGKKSNSSQFDEYGEVSPAVACVCTAHNTFCQPGICTWLTISRYSLYGSGRTHVRMYGRHLPLL